LEPRVVVLYVFVFITLLTAIAVIGAAIGLFPGAVPKLVSWGLPILGGEIIMTVALILRQEWGQRIEKHADSVR
jgi:hypothetical protein